MFVMLWRFEISDDVKDLLTNDDVFCSIFPSVEAALDHKKFLIAHPRYMYPQHKTRPVVFLGVYRLGDKNLDADLVKSYKKERSRG